MRIDPKRQLSAKAATIARRKQRNIKAAILATYWLSTASLNATQAVR